MENKWLIYSEEHGGWWKPASNGYCRSRKEAGRYTFEEAKEIVEGANKFLSGEYPNETMCPDW